MATPPSIVAFTTSAHDAFSFLGRFGFREVAAPAHRIGDAFRIWFAAEHRFVVVVGGGHGTMASVTLEYAGRDLSEIYLAPPGAAAAERTRKETSNHSSRPDS